MEVYAGESCVGLAFILTTSERNQASDTALRMSLQFSMYLPHLLYRSMGQKILLAVSVCVMSVWSHFEPILTKLGTRFWVPQERTVTD